MTYRVGVPRNDVLLLPECVDDYVGPENPVRAVDAFVEGVDLVAMGFDLRSEGDPGAPEYDPRAMLKLYLYGYINRIRSSRELKKATRRNLEAIWLMRRLMPDHWTINAFRREHRDCFKKVFRQFNLVCGSLGLFGADLVAIDGTFLKGVNNLRRNFTQNKVAKMLAEIDQRSEAYLKELDTADREAEAQSMAAEKGESKGARLKGKLAEMEQKRRDCHALLAAMTESPHGQISLTDPDSRHLEKASERTVGYNAQVAVDSTHHLIVAEEVTQEANDSQLLTPMAVAAKTALAVDHLQVVADSGYYDHAQVRQCVEAGIEPYVPQPKHPSAGKGLYGIEEFKYDSEGDLYVCPQGRELTRHSDTTKGGGTYHTYYAGPAACRACPVRGQCTEGRYRKLNLHQDQALIDAHRQRQAQKPTIQRQRAGIVEHVFGTLKFWQGYRSFLTRRLPMVRAEFTLSCLAYNFRRVLNLLGTKELLKAFQSAASSA